MSTPVLTSGYAEQSSRPDPIVPKTVMVTSSDIDMSRFYGFTRIEGSMYAVFKVKGKKRFFFQLYFGKE